MTDRELLELAAKAAGIVINTSRQAERDALNLQKPVGLWTATKTNWNPLADDGDALRLAVKLGVDGGTFRMVINSYQVTAYVSGNEGVDLLNDNDPYAATRRAIVRAAAEIGKTK